MRSLSVTVVGSAQGRVNQTLPPPPISGEPVSPPAGDKQYTADLHNLPPTVVLATSHR